MSQPTPAGWYPDPADPSRTRWWDGSQWTEQTGQAAAPVAPAAPAAPAAPRYGEYAATAGGSDLSAGYPASSAPAWPTAAPAVRFGPSAPGTDTNTIWVYLSIIASILPIVALFLIDWETYLRLTIAAESDPTVATELGQWTVGVLGISVLSYVLIGVSVLFAWLDWRELKKRGIAKPFHWAFAFLTLVISTAAVYIIGRTVVVRRETGKGFAPLWVWIGLTLLSWIIAGVWFAALFQRILELVPTV